MAYDYTLKIIVIGNAFVGKSSIIQSYINSNNRTSSDELKLKLKLAEYASTIGVDFFTKTVSIDDSRARVVIWDTTGQERYKSIIQSYYREAHAVFIVFDLADLSSLNDVPYWIEQTYRIMGLDGFIIILIGNKSDKISIQSAHIISIKDKYPDLKYIETSVLTNHNIDLVFEECIAECHRLGLYKNRLRVNTELGPKIKEDNCC